MTPAKTRQVSPYANHNELSGADQAVPRKHPQRARPRAPEGLRNSRAQPTESEAEPAVG
jgi:hypothetical protein